MLLALIQQLAITFCLINLLFDCQHKDVTIRSHWNYWALSDDKELQNLFLWKGRGRGEGGLISILPLRIKI